MLQTMLELFTTSEKAEAMLANPLIEFIFMALFGLFIITLIIHFALFFHIRKIRNYVKETNRLDIEPLHSIKTEFDQRQQEDSMKLETFIQEKFSSWQMFHIPIVNLIKMVQMTISVFILLGVLGTFIGLTISLGSISASSDQLVENVSGVLSGIDVAFYTSIVGMGFSLIMTVFTRAMNTEYLLTDLMLITESQLESEEQQGMNNMIAVSKQIHESIQQLEKTNRESLGSIVDAFDGFKDYTAGLQQSAKDLAAFNDGLAKNLDEFNELFQQMTEVTEGFRDGTNQLNENFTTLFSYFKKVDHNNERIAAAFESTYEKVAGAADAQVNSLETFKASVTDLKEFTSSLLDGQADVREQIEGISRKTADLTATMGVHNETFKELFGEDVSRRLGGIGTYLGDLKHGFDRLGDSIGTLPEALEVINQTQKAHTHLLGDRFRELKDFNERFSDHLRRHEQESTSYEKQLRTAASTFEQLATKNSSLLHEMNRTVTQVNQTFSQRDQQLEANVSHLKETLSSYVTTVENTLGSKLDAIVRNLDNSLYSLSEGMNRELLEMRRTSEEINQNHARLMQQLLQELGREIQTLNRQISSVGQETRMPTRTIGMNRNE